MFLLVILWSVLFCGKHEDKRVKTLFPTMVAIFFIERRIEPGDISFPCLFLGFNQANVFWVVACSVSWRWGGGSKF